jgi:hypothetical protein
VPPLDLHVPTPPRQLVTARVHGPASVLGAPNAQEESDE